jgi:predicted nicotinamide N-methyase
MTGPSESLKASDAATEPLFIARVPDEDMEKETILVEPLQIGSVVVQVTRPAHPDSFLDSASVAEAYRRDEYLPYWAWLWPISRALAAAVETERPRHGGADRAIEIGCGLGLPGVMALRSGFDVTFSDYDGTALAFAAINAAKVAPAERFRTMLLDWRVPSDATFDLVLASDLLYERRSVTPFVACLGKLLAEDGVALVADPDRAFAPEFRQEMTAAGLTWTETKVTTTPRGAELPVAGTIYRVRRA